ncbi:MAG TPA: HNH endonuclease [Rhizomicrobium sp.]|nr:HNH endonuclease [Rhizomicrobium sp.]
MNYSSRSDQSVLLMSLRKGAPYQDHVEDNGLTLIYEGHDASRGGVVRDPKTIDQPQYLPSGKLTENGKFLEAARRYKNDGEARLVRVYEKLRDGIWADNGDFHLVDAWQEKVGRRHVFKFKLVVAEAGISTARSVRAEKEDRTRIIPSAVKQEVWLRDEGKCTLCNSPDELHFDHIIPYAKGGSSLVASNIQLLCARHNLGKRDKIE